MKRKFISCFIFLCIILLAGCSSKQTTNSTPITKSIALSLSKVNNKYDRIEDIYDQAFQDNINKEIQKLKKMNQYYFDSPLVISNPYGTLTNGLYIYFKTDEKVQIQYTVSTGKYGEFKKIVYNNFNNNLSMEHETTLIGIIPDAINKITLTILDKNGTEQRSVQFIYNAPSKLGKYDDIQATIKKGDSTSELADGLYAILGNDIKNDKKDGTRFIAFYDNNGILRCEIPIVEYRANRILHDKNGMYFSIDHSNIVRIDGTGYVNRIYATDPYEQHHDCIFGGRDNLLVLGSDPKSNTTEDLILNVSLKTGKVSKLIDLKDYFKDYYNITSLPKGEKQKDWMHINSLTLTDDGKLLISSRETSTIITFENIYDNKCKVIYMLGSNNFWAGTGYENLLFHVVRDFNLHSGQHNITYIKDKALGKGVYYLVLYNNNNTYSSTRPKYDWISDKNYKGAGISSQIPAENSYYYKYLIDENKKSYQLVNSIPVSYSAYVSSIQDLDNGNVLIDSGSAMTAYEFDDKNTLIQSLSVSGTKWTYRITKYDFKNFWFK